MKKKTRNKTKLIAFDTYSSSTNHGPFHLPQVAALLKELSMDDELSAELGLVAELEPENASRAKERGSTSSNIGDAGEGEA